MSKEKPILFSTPMVRAILEGRKTQTRRALKPQPVMDAEGMWHWKDCQWMDGGLGFLASGIDDYAPCLPGDILWVRETWGVGTRPHPMRGWVDGIEFKADEKYLQGEGDDLYLYYTEKNGLSDVLSKNDGRGWRPSIFMPREAARLFLRVTDVRAERVQDINEEDAKAEGVTPINDSECGYRGAFRELWNALNAKRGFDWYSNPWVWVYRFERVDKPAGWPGGEVEK